MRLILALMFALLLSAQASAAIAAPPETARPTIPQQTCACANGTFSVNCCPRYQGTFCCESWYPPGDSGDVSYRSTPEQLDAVQKQIDALLSEPAGPERDAKYVGILEMNGYPIDQANFLSHQVFNGILLNPETANTVVGLYTGAGRPDLAVAFVERLDTSPPTMALPGAKSLSIDINAGTRSKLLRDTAELAAAKGLTAEATDLMQRAQNLNMEIADFYSDLQFNAFTIGQ